MAGSRAAGLGWLPVEYRNQYRNKSGRKISRGRARAASRYRGVGPPFVGYHRYRGTVGGQRVTVELTIGPGETYPQKKLTCTGSYYYGQAKAGLLDLSAEGTYQPRQPLRLQEMAGGKASGTWQATQVAGPLLMGTWSSPAGKKLPFNLREDYTDGQGRLMAVRYEVLQDDIKGPRCASDLREIYPRATLSREALHLLGADALQPALRRLQCARPALRRAAERAYVRGDGACCETSEELLVEFNDFGLLAFTTGTTQLSYEAGHFSHNSTSTIYDLRGGQELTLSDLLRPGADTLLQKLLTQHLLHDPPNDGEAGIKAGDYAEGGQLVPLPDRASLSYTGLVCGYGEGSIGALLGFESFKVPYAELLPLLRPDSPVARMLRERGLWHPARR